MATSQSLASIMEEMVTKVMEDAVSTSIIFTQAPVDESGKEKDLVSVTEVDISGSSFCTSGAHLDLNLNQTRRRLFHVPPIMNMVQQATTIEQTRLDQGVANEINPSEEVVELLLEELLHTVLGEKISDDASSDFFSQDSTLQPQHLAPCSQDFAFFKAIEQTREDLTTVEEDESQEELSPPSQLVCSPSTSELGDLLGWPSTPATKTFSQRTAAGVSRLANEEIQLFQSTRGRRAVLITPGPGIQLCPLTQNYSSADERMEQDGVISLDSREDFFSSQEGAPALKRRKTLLRDQDIEVVGNEQPFNDDSESEETDDNRRTGNEEEALPLTFHTKEDLIRKLQHLPRGDEVSHHRPMQSISITGCGEVGGRQLTMVERSREVALEKGVERCRRAAVRGQDKPDMEDVVVKKELPCKVEGEVEFQRKDSEDKDMNLATKEGDGETLRQDSYEDIATMENKNKNDFGKEGSVMTRSHQPLLLHRAPRLGLSRLQKPSGIHDITIIKDVSFNEGSDSDVSFIKEE